MPFHLWVNFFDGVKWTPFFRVFCAKSSVNGRLVNGELEKKPLDIRRQTTLKMAKFKRGHFLARFKAHLAKMCIFKSQNVWVFR